MMNRELITSAKSGLWSSDYSLIVIDAAKDIVMKNARVQKSIAELMVQAVRSSGDFAVVLNKVDLVTPKTKLIDLAFC